MKHEKVPLCDSLRIKNVKIRKLSVRKSLVIDTL